MHDRKSIYTIPEVMRQEGLDREILSILKLHDRVSPKLEDRARDEWMGFVKRLTVPKTRRGTIGVTGKYVAMRDAYASSDKAIEHPVMPPPITRTLVLKLSNGPGLDFIRCLSILKCNRHRPAWRFP